MRNYLLFLLILFTFLPTFILGQLDPITLKKIDDFVLQEKKKQGFIGVAIGVIYKGEIAYLKGYGYANREKRIPVTEKTMFRWASMSKPLTAVVAMRLSELDKLDIESNIRLYYPSYPQKSLYIMRAKHILCHHSGIVHYRQFTNYKIYLNRHYPDRNLVPFSGDKSVNVFRSRNLLFTSGDAYNYSSFAYNLLGAVLENAGGKKFPELVDEYIAKPANMTGLQPDYQWKNIPYRAIGYKKVNGKTVISGNTDVSWKLPGGGFISNIHDLAAFVEALINYKLVSAETSKIMWTRQITKKGYASGYGLGFDIYNHLSPDFGVRHGGAQEKTRTRFAFFPTKKFGVVVMSNSEWASPVNITTGVMRILNEETLTISKSTIFDSISKAIPEDQ